MRALKSLELELYIIVSYHTDAENWALVFYESHKCSFAPELSVQTSIFVWLFVFKISYEYYGLYHFCPSFSPLQLPPVLYSLNFIVFSLQLLLLQIHKQIEKQMTYDRQTDSQIDITEASIALRYMYRSDHFYWITHREAFPQRRLILPLSTDTNCFIVLFLDVGFLKNSYHILLAFLLIQCVLVLLSIYESVPCVYSAC